MSAWPWIDLEKKKKEQQDIEAKMIEIYQQISDHFGTCGMISPWVIDIFTKSVLIQGGVDILIKHGYCEKCIHYIGINPIKRKLYKIPVLNAYCIEHAEITYPENRCHFIDFDPFWKQIIKYNISKTCTIKYPFPNPKLIDDVNEDYKKMLEEGFFDDDEY